MKMEPAEKIRKVLLWNEEELEHQLERTKKYIRLTKEGRVVFSMKQDKINTRFQVALYLLGKHYAHEAGLGQTNEALLKELAKELRLPEKSITARITELKADSYVENSSRGSYRIVVPRAAQLLDDIENSVGGQGHESD